MFSFLLVVNHNVLLCSRMCPPFRYLNTTLHPKPYQLQHPSELWKHTAFEGKSEYDLFVEQPSTLGKPTASHPNGGMKQKYHDFADKIWNKFKVVRREIASQTAVIWARLLPGNHLPSGILMPEVVYKLRLEMFLKWQFEPTSKGSKQKYSPITMDGLYAKWCPVWFPTWRAMGPPSGMSCSQIFMAECCGFPQVSADASKALPGALESHFLTQASDVAVVSRHKAAQLRKFEENKAKEEQQSIKSLKQESKQAMKESQANATQLFLELELSKEKRQQRADSIERLKYMISRALCPILKESLERDLDLIYAAPISPAAPSSNGSFSASNSRSDGGTFSPIAPMRLNDGLDFQDLGADSGKLQNEVVMTKVSKVKPIALLSHQAQSKDAALQKQAQDTYAVALQIQQV